MSWQTLRDFIDVRWAAAVAGYSGDMRTALKAGPVTAIARGIDDEGLIGVSGFSNLYDETYSFAAAGVASHLQAMVESNYGDGWWAHRPLTFGYSTVSVGAMGVFNVFFQAAGAEDTYGVFNGPGLCLTLGGRLPLLRGQSLVLACRAGLSNPADYNAAGEYCRIGAVVSGLHPGGASRSVNGMSPQQIWFGVGHGIYNNPSTATIENISMRIE